MLEVALENDASDLKSGSITALIGVLSFWYLPPSPTQTKSWFRGKNGWFSEREEVILVNRILRDDPSKGDMHNRQGLSVQMFRDSLADYDMWLLYLLGLLIFIPMTPPSSYLTLTLRQLGFNTFKTNLLVIPANVLLMIQMIVLARVSRRIKERAFTAMLGSLWVFPLLITLIFLPADVNHWGKYAVLVLLLGYPYCHPILVAWNSANSNSVRTRTISASLYNMSVQLGNIVSTQIYRADDAPLYRRGNKILLGINVASIFVFLITKVYYIQRNKWKARRWDAMTVEEKENYLATTTDKGNKRLDFRFFH
ncbi:ophD encodes a permease for phthalate transporter [Atractiella rhizophila]|nr:ophD encodes a permease for phthalate transporter [Atractiella rhizophila]